jgi:hypothetical protein
MGAPAPCAASFLEEHRRWVFGSIHGFRNVSQRCGQLAPPCVRQLLDRLNQASLRNIR